MLINSLYKFFDAENFDDFVHKAFVQKTKSGRVQFFRYLFVGGISVVADAGSLFLFTSGFHVFYLISAVIGFVLGTIVNYILSILWIFERTNKFKSEVTLFTLIGAGGLGLNELILWVLVSRAGVFYLVAKAISVSIVLIWSFTLRRILFTKLTNQPA